MTERECTYLISRMESVGPVRFDRLLTRYGTAQEAWSQTEPTLTEHQSQEWKIFHREETTSRLLRELDELPKKGCRFLMRSDEEFPPDFLSLHDCPVGLYVRGRRLPGPETPAAAMVGARDCSAYGRNAASLLGRELAERGVAVISGMAMGIDACSQWAALRAGGLSVAVLGSGIDVCYPSCNRSLYEGLCERGAVLSEYGPGTGALGFHFPVRNRLISALARVILVIEAREKSGSLITVDRALEQGKDVLALPGRMGDPVSVGCNNLIRQGAGIITSVEDVCAALGMETKEKSAGTGNEKTGNLTPDQEKIYALLGTEPVHQDVLAERAGMTVSDLLLVLWDLETAGLCRQCTAGTYMRQE